MFKSSKFFKDIKRVVTIAIVVCFSLLIFMGFIMNFNKIVNKHNELNVSAAYDFNSTALNPDDANYKNNSVFNISTDRGLRGFAASVANGCTFKSKTVKLTESIDYTREYDDQINTFKGVGVPSDDVISFYTDHGSNPPIYAFCGTFDGCGYTVNTFKMKLDYEFNIKEWGDVVLMHSGGYLGFFGVLGEKAIVKNLKLKNINYYVDKYKYIYSTSGAYIGSIAGCVVDGATIENCEVSGFNIYDSQGVNKNERDEFVGGLVGLISKSNKGSAAYNIRDCYIEKFRCELYSMQTAYLNYGGSFDRAIGAFVGVDNINGYGNGICGTITNCVLEDSNSYIATNGYKNEYIAGYLTTPEVNKGQFIQKQDNYSKLGKDISIGGKDEGGAWYWSSDYNNGYPRLRQFISSWKTVTFNSNPEKSATFNETSIQIPSDANKTYSSGGSTIEIYNRVITATAEPGYRILGWKCNSATSYTVNCELIPFKLTFINASSFATMKVDGTIKTSDTMELNYGSVVNFSSEVDNGICTYTYEISNAGNVLKTVTYTTKSNKYTMGMDDNNNLINGFDGAGTYEITFSAGITSKTAVPNFELKDYNVTLK